MKISLILPAYNEEAALPKTLEEYYNYADEIIIVNDGSHDNTDKIASDYASKLSKVKYIKHDVNKGKPEALRTGVKNATGDILVFTDTDCTYPARYIPQAEELIRNGSDMVLGARVFKKENIRGLNRFGNRIFSFLIAYFCYTRIMDSQTGFRLMRKDIFPRLDVPARNLEYETKMTMRAAKLGYNIKEIPIEYRERVGKSKLHPIRDGYYMLMSIPTIIWAESNMLLKSVLVINAVLFLAGLGFGLYSIYDKITNVVLAHEYYPLISVVCLITAMQLMSFSIIIDFVVNKLNQIDDKLRNLR